LLFFLLISLCCSFNATAQDRIVSGKVTDGSDGSTLPGVNIVLKGTTTGTVSDIDGNYSLTVPSTGGFLVFTSIGYTEREVEIGNQSTIDMAMEADVQQLSEVVVIGYGTQQKRDISGAVASVKGDAIENIPISSFDRALQGRAAGVQVSSGNGQPGGAVSVRIRGTGSINAANSPLYIIDGVVVNDGDQSRTLDTSNALNSLNPNDIASIDVLKDAASASIYGAQAANGVVIITTKRGEAGKTQFTLNASYGANERLNKLDVLTGPQFVELSLAAWENSFQAGLVSAAAYNNAQARLGNPADAPTYDWQDAVYQTGINQNYELNASGGTDASRYFISASYNNQQGQIRSSDFERGTIRINLDNKVSDKLSFKTSVNLATVSQQTAVTGAFFTTPSISYLIVPTNPIYNDDGSFNTSFTGLFTSNTVEALEKNTRTGNTKSLTGNFELSYNILPFLTYRGSVSLDFNYIQETRFFDPTATGTGVTSNGSISELSSNRTNVQTDHTLTFHKLFDDRHDVTVMGGFQYRNDKLVTVDAIAQNFATPLLSTLNNTSVYQNIAGGNTTFVIAGFFGRAGYIFDDKYILNATVRYDGSSRFGDQNQWGLFPSVSAAWRLSKESFMSGLSLFQDLKIRASYGETGNSEIGNFASRDLWGVGIYNGNPTLVPAQVPNNMLQWERNKTLNFGLDFTILEGRLGGAIDVYRRDTEDLLLNKPLPMTTGFASVTSNVGSLRNEGIEFELNSVNIVAGDFKWTSLFNISFQRSEVTGLAGDSDTLVVANAGGTYIVGQPARAFYLQEWAGVNPADGRGMWYDQDGNIIYQNISGDTRAIRGSANPDNFGGFTNTFSYKGFNLDVFFQWQMGNLKMFTTAYTLHAAGSFENANQTIEQYTDRWRAPGDITNVTAPYINEVHPNGGGSPTNGNDTREVYDASYLRLKNISLSYDFSPEILQKLKLQRLRIYAQGVNLWTKTNWPGLDPEVAGADFGAFPQGKTYTLGLSVGF
jgi:TonB-linked SusC/RagA family outer membrane protein